MASEFKYSMGWGGGGSTDASESWMKTLPCVFLGDTPAQGDSGTFIIVLLWQPRAQPLYVYMVLSYSIALVPGVGTGCFIIKPTPKWPSVWAQTKSLTPLHAFREKDLGAHVMFGHPSPTVTFGPGSSQVERRCWKRPLLGIGQKPLLCPYPCGTLLFSFLPEPWKIRRCTTGSSCHHLGCLKSLSLCPTSPSPCWGLRH